MDFVRGREVLRETREEVAKSGEVLRESRLVFFEWSGEGENNACFPLFYVCKSRNRDEFQTKLLVKLIFSAQNEISGEKILHVEEENTPKKYGFCPKSGRIGRKKAVLG